VTALARAGSGYVRQTCPLVVVAPHRRARDSQIVLEVWSWVPDGCFVPGRTGLLTVRRNMRHNSTSSCLPGNEHERKKSGGTVEGGVLYSVHL
jgi:hypothetical protein